MRNSAHVGILVEVFLRNYVKDDVPWMCPVALWTHACHGNLSDLVVSLILK